MYEIFSKLLQIYGVTPYRISKETGVSQSTLSDWKSGKITPKSDNLKKIADYFGVSVDYLMTGKEPESKVKVVDEDNNVIILDDDTLELIDSLRSKPEMKMLFSVSKNATREDIIKTVKIIEALKNDK